MTSKIEVPKPLKLDGTFNTRDLGGYPSASGKITQTHRLLRSDGLHQLSPKDQQTLYDYGVRKVIDLRSKYECEKNVSRMAEYRDVAYEHVPMLDRIQSDGFEAVFPSCMSEMYMALLAEYGAAVASALRAILAEPMGCVLFHCTAGKDRTGVIAMLLLLLCGVPESIVIADYAATQQNIAPAVDAQKKELLEKGIAFPEHVFGSDPDQMKITIDYLDHSCGGAEKHIRTIGLDDLEIAALRDKLLQ